MKKEKNKFIMNDTCEKPPSYTKDPVTNEWFYKKWADFEAIGMQWIGLPIAGFISVDGKVFGGYWESFNRQTPETWPKYLASYKELVDKYKNDTGAVHQS